MPKKKLEGLDGWLILPIIGLFLSIFLVLYDLLSVLSQYEFNAYIGILFLMDLALLTLAIISLVLIFNKKKTAPKWIISFYITNLVLYLVISSLIDDFSGIIQPIIVAAIWIPYFLKSKRVKNTFVK